MVEGYLIYLLFQRLVIPLYLTVRLRVKWRRQNVLYPHQLKIIAKCPGYVPGTIIR